MFNENIPNQSLYVSSMEKTILDKALFMSHIDADIIVDFGCANGALIKFLSSLFPTKEFIGYDISKEMLNIASKNLSNTPNFVLLTDNWFSIMERIKTLKMGNQSLKTCLVCSSVIHEVYSYSTRKEINIFWERFWKSGFDYIAVRDMYSANMERLTGRFEVSFIDKVAETIYSSKLDEFIEKYGTLSDADTFNHFILKYIYNENWERELNEDYMPYDGRIHEMTRCVDGCQGYRKIFDIKYILPYIKQRAFDDFGIELTYPTHYQLIFKKK